MVAGGKDWEFWVSKLKLSHTEWMNKVLLDSTRNYIQYLMMNYNANKQKKNIYIIYTYTHIYVCVCITESLCCKQKLTLVNQLYFNKKLKNYCHRIWISEFSLNMSVRKTGGSIEKHS